MKNLLFFIILIPFVMLSAQNAEPVLDLYPSAVSEGSSGNILLESNPSSFFFSPAFPLSGDISMMYEHKFLMSNISQYNSVFAVLPFSRINIGLGYINQLISGIPEYPEYPDDPDSVSFEPLGHFSDMSNAFLLNASYMFTPSYYSPYRFSAGLNLKYIYHTIYEATGMGAGVDAGAGAEADLERLFGINLRTAIYISMTDIGGTKISWNTQSNHEDTRNMLFRADLVLAGNINYDTEAAIEMVYMSSGVFGIGTAVTMSRVFSVYAGTDISSGLDMIRPGIGASVNLIGLELAYGISSNDIGINHSVSIKYTL